MGFYLRKSLKAGPFRFNLSKSGLGVSTGIKGLRFGSGPRGNYVHMGRGGIYYRASLGGGNSGSGRKHSDGQQAFYPPSQPAIHDHTIGNMEAIDSGNVLEMSDASSAGLLEELNNKLRLATFFSPSVFSFVFLTAITGYSSTVGGVAIAAVALPLCWFIWNYDQARKSVVLFYDFDPEQENTYEHFHEKFAELSSCQRLWNIDSKGDVLDQKYNAGADSVVTRNRISPALKAPPFVKTNIAVPMLPAGKQTLYFFPDRLLVYEDNSVGAVSYDAITSESGTINFVEQEGVPSDARVVDHTWRYVNKSGGPDKRFKDNPQIPVAEYGTLHLKSASGLNELMHFSCTNMPGILISGINLLAKNLQDSLAPVKEVRDSGDHRQSGKIPRDSSITPSKINQKDIFADTLLDAMCCIMVADGKVRSTEKKIIAEVACSVLNGWTEGQVDGYISGFLEKAQKCGRAACISETIRRLSELRDFGQRQSLVMHLNQVARADGNIDTKEKQVFDQFVQALRL